MTVVGVVGDARMGRMSREAAPAVYTSLACWSSSYVTVYLRSTVPADTLRRSVQEASRQADGGASLLEFQSLESLAARELEEPKALRRQTLGAGILATFLAGIGLMGTLGTAFAWVLGRVLQHQLQGVSPADPGLLASAMVSLGLTCFLAGLAPALRVARTQPSETLRSE